MFFVFESEKGKRHAGAAILLSVFLLFFLLCGSAASADPAPEDQLVSDVMISFLTENREKLFPINSQKESFSQEKEYLFSDIGPDTVVRIGTEGGKRHVTLFVNSDSLHDYNAFESIDTGFPENFEMTMDVTVDDVYPRDQGGCFIGFTNEGLPSAEKNEPFFLSAVINGQDVMMYTKKADEEAGTHAVIGSSTRIPTKLTVIHLHGHTYIYANDVFVGQYHDGQTGFLRMIYGAAVFSEGDTANCSFDNLIIRKVTNR